MRNNKNLNQAKREKYDEFYAIITEIEKEIMCYKHEFNEKIVFCNCNDGLHTSFVDFFIQNFDFLKLQKLIYSSYGEGDDNGMIFIYDGEETISKELDSKGDFRYGECLDTLLHSDIIVTGPPFSLFREFINLMQTYNKKFLVIGDVNSMVCKDIFPQILNKTIQFGFTNPREFIVPDTYKGESFVDTDGLRKTKLGKTVWYTNIPHNSLKKPILLTKKYSAKKYPKCDNFDAIWVNKVKDIPKDYKGLMCVPITYLQKHCELQFEIIGITDNSELVKQHRIEDQKDYSRPYLNGAKKIYRLLIKRINKTNKHINQLTTKEKYDFVTKMIFLMEKFNPEVLETFYYGNKDINDEYEWCLRTMRNMGFKFKHVMNMKTPTEEDFEMVEEQEW